MQAYYIRDVTHSICILLSPHSWYLVIVSSCYGGGSSCSCSSCRPSRRQSQGIFWYLEEFRLSLKSQNHSQGLCRHRSIGPLTFCLFNIYKNKKTHSYHLSRYNSTGLSYPVVGALVVVVVVVVVVVLLGGRVKGISGSGYL